MRIMIVALAIVGLILTIASMKRIEAGEVGIRVNLFSGTEEILDREGIVSVVPFIHELYKLDATPQTVTLQGDRTAEDFSVLPRLTVRAADGSNFWFETMTVQYQIIPELAAVILAEVGHGNDFRRWLQPALRSILRDAFGQRSTMQVSDPTTYGVSKAEAERLLNERLNPHGVRIINIDTPMPQFVEQYEHAIEERITTDNQSEVIRQELERAEATRQRELAALDQQLNRTYQERRAVLEGELANVLAQRRSRINEAQAALTRAEGEGLALVDGANARAAEVSAQWTATVGQVDSRVTALSMTGREAVMRELAKRLGEVTISVTPIHQDGSPQTVRLLQGN